MKSLVHIASFCFIFLAATAKAAGTSAAGVSKAEAVEAEEKQKTNIAQGCPEGTVDVFYMDVPDEPDFILHEKFSSNRAHDILAALLDGNAKPFFNDVPYIYGRTDRTYVIHAFFHLFPKERLTDDQWKILHQVGWQRLFGATCVEQCVSKINGLSAQEHLDLLQYTGQRFVHRYQANKDKDFKVQHYLVQLDALHRTFDLSKTPGRILEGARLREAIRPCVTTTLEELNALKSEGYCVELSEFAGWLKELGCGDDG
jgi:hypothetical protein